MNANDVENFEEVVSENGRLKEQLAIVSQKLEAVSLELQAAYEEIEILNARALDHDSQNNTEYKW